MVRPEEYRDRMACGATKSAGTLISSNSTCAAFDTYLSCNHHDGVDVLLGKSRVHLFCFLLVCRRGDYSRACDDTGEA